MLHDIGVIDTKPICSIFYVLKICYVDLHPKKIFMEAVDIKGGIYSFTRWLQSVLINKVRPRATINSYILQWKVHTIVQTRLAITLFTGTEWSH